MSERDLTPRELIAVISCVEQVWLNEKRAPVGKRVDAIIAKLKAGRPE